MTEEHNPEHHSVPFGSWSSRGKYDLNTGHGEWWVAPGGYELHKKGERWVAFKDGVKVCSDWYLSNCMMRLDSSGEK